MSAARRIKELLREGVAQLAQYLFPNGHREGVHWCVGNIEGEPDKSFKICISGPKASLWGDFADSRNHSRSLLDLWMHARNVDFKTALREAAQWLGEPLNGHDNGGSIFSTLDEAIANMEQRLAMRITRRDPYHDREGNEHFVVARFDGATGKQFRPFHKKGSAWIAKDPLGLLPLFRLPELIARKTERVFVVEGEKPARELATLGLLVTTSAHGAKSAHKTDWRPLAGREVVILPDNDAEGRRAYAQTVAGIVSHLSPPAEARIVELPGLPPKGDCVDWLEARDARTPEEITAELLAMVKGAEITCQAKNFKSELTEIVEARPFPLHCLPPVCEAMGRAVCETVRVLESLPGSCVIGILSAAPGKGLQVRSGANRVTRANVYIVASADSGSGKSETFRHTAKPFLDFEAERVATWKSEIKPELLAEYKILDAEIAKLTKSVGNANGSIEREEIRAEKRFDDTGTDALRGSRNDHCLPIKLHIGRSSCVKAVPISIAGKFVSSDVVFIDTAFNQHLSQPTHHGGGTGDIVDRPSQIIQILGQHFFVDPLGLAVPGFLRARHVGHRGNKTEVWVCLL